MTNLRAMRMRRAVIAFALIAIAASPLTASHAAVSPLCDHRLLVLSAFPGEIDHLLAKTTITTVVNPSGRTFYLGTLGGNKVALGLTGIGIVNADATTRTALGYFRCQGALTIDGIVFSGVSGGRTFIGDVTIPTQWTLDGGGTYPVDQTMYDTAVATSASVKLADQVPLGDLACIGLDPDLIETIKLPHQPVVIAGGRGHTADPFGGREFPCIPGGGDVFGCRPCRAPDHRLHPFRFLRDAPAFIDPNFFLGYFQNPTPSTATYDAEDMETASVARVAHANGLPFIAFRALSDGQGDPLHLPGFPFQFFIYRQIAANNAAATAYAFLAAWAHR